MIFPVQRKEGDEIFTLDEKGHEEESNRDRG